MRNRYCGSYRGYLGILSAGVMMAMTFVAAGCSAHGHGDGENEGGSAGHEQDGKHVENPLAIHMEPQDAVRFGVTVEGVMPDTFQDAVRVAAEVLPSASDIATSSAPTSGIVSLSPGITQGATVTSGQVIARVRGGSVSGGDVNAAGKVAIENAKRELDRLTPLLSDGLITKKEYNDALAAYESAKAAYSPSAAAGVVKAPKSGVITDLLATEGSYVNTGDPVALISGSGRLTLRALLPVGNSNLLPVVSGVVITPHGEKGSAIDLTEYDGKMLSTSAAASASTPGYIPVFYSFSNQAPVVAGSAAEVYLRGGMRNGVISVPSEALCEQLGEKFVFVKTGGHEYEKRFVSTGVGNGERVEIKDGLNPGDSVVVKGVSFVRLAEQSTAVPEGHSHNH